MEREKMAIRHIDSQQVRTKALNVGYDPAAPTDHPGVDYSATLIHGKSMVYANAAGATFTIGDEAANVINVAVQINDMDDDALAGVRNLLVYLSDAETGIGVAAAAPDGGIAVGTDGAVIEAHTAAKVLTVQTDADGKFDLDITETGALDSWYLAIVRPSDGVPLVSGAITFAA